MDAKLGMTVWLANNPTILTAWANPTAKLTAYFKPRSSALNFTKVNAEFIYRNERIWELQTQFDIGEYYIKVVIEDSALPGDDELMLVVKTVSGEDYSTAIANAIVRADLEAAKSAILQRTSFQPVG